MFSSKGNSKFLKLNHQHFRIRATLISLIALLSPLLAVIPTSPVNALVQGTSNTGTYYGGSGGTAFSAIDCDAGSVVTRIGTSSGTNDGTNSSYVSAFDFDCTPLTSAMALTTPTTTKAVLNSPTNNSSCPTGTAAVGIKVLSGSYIADAGVICATLPDRSSINTSIAMARGQASNNSYTCPAYSYLVGFIGKKGGGIDQIAPRCAVFSDIAITTPSSGLTGTAGTPYSLDISSSGGFGTKEFLLSSGSLPSGLTLNSTTGVISGTPTTVENKSVRISATDGTTLSAVTSSFTLSISSGSLSNAAAPTVTATAGTLKSISVSWSAVTNAASYTLKLYAANGSSLLKEITGLSGPSRIITTSDYAEVADNTQYQVSITAIGDANYASSSESTKVSVTTNRTLTVTYDHNGGSGIASSSYITGATALTLPTPTRANYTFAGWYEAADLTGSALGASYTPTQDKTLYASWALETYPITLTKGTTGTGSNQTLTKTYGQNLTLPDSVTANGYFTRTGYTITGWATSDGGAKVYELGGSFTTDAATTLYPFWSGNTYTITYSYDNATGGNSTVSDPFTVGGSGISLPTPTKTGFRFRGWYESSSFTGSALSSPYSPTQTRTIYAKWTSTLILDLDAGNSASYPGTGTTWTNLVNGSTYTITNGTYSRDYGGTISFNGSSTLVDLGTPLASNSSYTIEAWVFDTGVGANRNIVSSASHVLFISSSTLYGGIANSYTLVSSANFPTNVWTHVVLTFDDAHNTMTLYVNGEQKSQRTGITASYTQETMRIGAHFVGSPVSFWNGKIARVKIYDEALDSAQVTSAFNDDTDTYLVEPPLNPTFGSATATADGFMVQITNYESHYIWSGTATAGGSVTISGTGLVTVSGVAAATSVTVTITTTRPGYSSGSETKTATSLLAGLNPTFDTPAATGSGFTVQISNYDSNYTWAGTATASGSVSISNTGLVTVTGVASSTTVSATITTSRSGYGDGLATVTATTKTRVIYDFNKVGQLTNEFNSYVAGGTISQSETGGISNTGSIYTQWAADAVFASKATYSMGATGSSYTFTAYLKSVGNSGYSGMGFTSLTPSSSTTGGTPFRPTDALGISVHGGGYVFHNGGTDFHGNWGSTYSAGNSASLRTVTTSSISDLLNNGSPDRWYKVILVIERIAGDKFKLRVEVWSVDSAGALLRPAGADAIVELVEQSNSTILNAASISSYVNFSGYRVTNFDDYQVELDGATVIEAGTPVVLTNSATESGGVISVTGNVTSDGGSSITARGFVFATSQSPTISDSKVESTAGTGSFSLTTSSLPKGTYYVRAFATNAIGTSYGTQSQIVIVNDNPTYTITYDLNGGTGTAPTESAKATGESITVKDDTGFSRSNYTFAGWKIGSQPYAAGDAVTVATTNLTFIAQWNPAFVVSFDANSGSAVSSITYTGTELAIPTNPTRANFVFEAWTLAGNDISWPYTPTGPVTLTARWTQLSLYGLDPNDLANFGSLTARAGVSASFSGANATSSVTVNVPAGALPEGTVINIDLVGNTQRARSVISADNSYLVSFVVSWLATDGTVPTTAANKPISMTITNSLIKAGAAIYSVIGEQYTVLGRATQDGTVTIEITQDPEILVAATKPDAPTSVTGSNPTTTTLTASWSAPLVNGGSAIINYTATTNTGQSCTTTSLSCTINGLTANTLYTISVVATNSIGTSVASTASAAVRTSVISGGGGNTGGGNTDNNESTGNENNNGSGSGSGSGNSGSSNPDSGNTTEVQTPTNPVLTTTDGKPVVPPTGETRTIINGAYKTELIKVIENTVVRTEFNNAAIEVRSVSSNNTTKPLKGESTLVFEPAGQATLSGAGFKPVTKVKVWIFSTPTFLGEAEVKEDGSFNAALLIPANFPIGSHTLQINGVTKANELVTQTFGVVIEPAARTVNPEPRKLIKRVVANFGYNLNQAVPTKSQINRVKQLTRSLSPNSVVTCKSFVAVKPVTKTQLSQASRLAVSLCGPLRKNPDLVVKFNRKAPQDLASISNLRTRPVRVQVIVRSITEK